MYGSLNILCVCGACVRPLCASTQLDAILKLRFDWDL